MDNKITLREWSDTLFKGIRQGLFWVLRMFDPRHKTPFWRIIWCTITVCIVSFTSMIGYAFYNEFIKEKYHSWEIRRLSDRCTFYDRGPGKGYVYDCKSQNKTITGIDWIRGSDSLMVYSKDGKRGYFNRYTGHIDIPAQYDAAWIFSDGVAGVCVNDSVFFIDRSGCPINGCRYPYDYNYDDYCYHGEYLKLKRDGKFGLVDRKGEWRLPPVYDWINIEPRNMWQVRINGKCGIYSPQGAFTVPCQYRNAYVSQYDGIIVSLDDNRKQKFDYNGTMIENFLIDEIYLLEYLTDEYDDNGNRKAKAANHHKYSVDLMYGLMDRNGKAITLPLYTDIEALSPDIYQCHTNDGCILLDSKGVKINI